jgi:hypothetical protein
VRALVIPKPVSLGAILAAAFLFFPAMKGLTSGSSIRHLETVNHTLAETLAETKTRNVQLERELAERDIRLSQRQQAANITTGSGLYISPLLYLESAKKRTPDLISIDFTQSDQAMLVFSLPQVELRDVEVSVYQDTRLAWNQSIAIPKEKLLNQSLVTLMLTRSTLAPGDYRMTIEGNPTGKRISLTQFDLSILG